MRDESLLRTMNGTVASCWCLAYQDPLPPTICLGSSHSLERCRHDDSPRRQEPGLQWTIKAVVKTFDTSGDK